MSKLSVDCQPIKGVSRCSEQSVLFKSPTHTHQSSSHLFNKGQQSLAVVLPLKRKFAFMGKLVAAQEDGEFEAVGVQVAEVIHTCGRGRHRAFLQDQFTTSHLYQQASNYVDYFYSFVQEIKLFPRITHGPHCQEVSFEAVFYWVE